jgi:hypothetical protein
MRKKVIEVVKTPSKQASPPKKVLKKLPKTNVRRNGRRPQKKRIKARKSRR